MISGLCMIIVGIWLWRISQRRRYPAPMINEAQWRRYLKRTEPPPNPEWSLNRKVADDAMQREARAKAALRGILQAHGCTEQQIDDVMATVDNTEEGDCQ